MLLGRTTSLCPWCLKRIPAERIAEGNAVYLKKSCPEHGEYKTVLWRGTAESYVKWGEYGEVGGCSSKALTPSKDGCPLDCGLCPTHTGGVCVALMEVTNRCNISCPICFSGSPEKDGHEPDLAAVQGMYRTILDSGGPFPLQLSGGEPTLRDDLPEIVALGKQMGFEMIQINTNGIRFAKDRDYLARIKENGAGTLYLQFDGVTDDIYLAMRGAALADLKAQAIENCAAVGVGVILVVVLIPGINVQQVGSIIQYAKERMPVVRGVHFQPVSYFGRYPHAPRDQDRITLPEVLQALEKQTAGEITTHDFKPKRNKESYCSFSGVFMRGDDGVLRAASDKEAMRNTATPDKAVRQFLQNYWSPVGSSPCCAPGAKPSSEDAVFQDLINWVQSRSLTVSGMPFQDVWNIDLERLEGCCIHVVTADKRLVPFCARYMTSMEGKRLY